MAEERQPRGRDRDRNREEKIDDGMIEKLVAVNRVSKTVKGGRQFTFTALTVVGDGDGKVGFGYGKAREVPVAIQKSMEYARKGMLSVDLTRHLCTRQAATAGARVHSPLGSTGVIAAAHAPVLEAWAEDVLPSLGSRNPINLVRHAEGPERQHPDPHRAKRGKKWRNSSMANESNKTVKVRLVRGLRGTQSRHRLSVKALGLNKLNDVRELKDSPQVRGLINQLHYLVRVED